MTPWARNLVFCCQIKTSLALAKSHTNQGCTLTQKNVNLLEWLKNIVQNIKSECTNMLTASNHMKTKKLKNKSCNPKSKSLCNAQIC